MLHIKARALLAGLAVVCSGTWAQAQCSMDNECTGDLLCQDGQCVAPPPAAAAPAAPSAAPPPSPAPPMVAAAPAEAPPVVAAKSEDDPDSKLPRRSPAMMVGGAVMIPVGALVLAIAVMTSGPRDCKTDQFGRVTPAEFDRCDNKTRTFLLGIGGALLVGGGIPLVIIGAKRVPGAKAASAGIAPWLSPDAAGLNLQLTM